MAALNWQPPIVPSGMVYNPGDTSFTNELFNFLLPLEVPSTAELLTLTLVPTAKNSAVVDPTIGLGFDLVTGGVTVQNAVLDALGFVPAIVALTAPPTAGDGPEALVEYNYIQQIRSDIALQSAAGVSAMNAVMAERYSQYESDPAFAAYVSGLTFVAQRSTFTFQSTAEVYGVFQLLWSNYYEPQIFAQYQYLDGTSFQGSREEEALASMIWNGGKGLLGSALGQALEAGNRAEAWFQIRYGSNGSKNPIAAARQYYVSQVFGLFDNPDQPTSTEALQAYQMLTTNTEYASLSTREENNLEAYTTLWRRSRGSLHSYLDSPMEHDRVGAFVASVRELGRRTPGSHFRILYGAG